MEEHPLVPFRDAEHVADVVARESLHVPEDHNLALPRRQLAERLTQAGDQVAATNRSSASAHDSNGWAQAPAESKRLGSTAGSPSDNDRSRCSRRPPYGPC